MRSFFTILVCVFLVSAMPSFAVDTKSRLQHVETDLKTQQAQAKKLQEQQADIEDKLQELQQTLVTMAQALQKHEREALHAQQQADATRAELTLQQETLEKQRKAMAGVIMALQRLARMPPQMLLMRPDKPIDTARSFYLLQDVMPKLNAQAEQIKETVTKLVALQDKYVTQQQRLRAQYKKLVAQRKELQTQVKTRQALLQQTKQQQQQTTTRMAALSKQARDLRDLVIRVEKTTIPVEPQTTPRHRITRTLQAWFGSAKNFVTPVAGDIATAYGDVLPGGGKSQGVTIAATKDALVVAPSDGIVRFAGPFRQYKLLIIVQHSTGEHSLLGGLQEIYTRVGAHVVAGEPLGKLSGDSGAQVRLYYERRRNGKTIDPRLARG